MFQFSVWDIVIVYMVMLPITAIWAYLEIDICLFPEKFQVLYKIIVIPGDLETESDSYFDGHSIFKNLKHEIGSLEFLHLLKDKNQQLSDLEIAKIKTKHVLVWVLFNPFFILCKVIGYIIVLILVFFCTFTYLVTTGGTLISAIFKSFDSFCGSVAKLSLQLKKHIT